MKALPAMRRIACASTVEVFKEKVQLLKDDKELLRQSSLVSGLKSLADNTRQVHFLLCNIISHRAVEKRDFGTDLRSLNSFVATTPATACQ